MNARARRDRRLLRSLGGISTEGVNSGVKAGTISDFLVEVRARYELLPNDEVGTSCVDLDDSDDENSDGGDAADNEFAPIFACRARCRSETIKVRGDGGDGGDGGGGRRAKEA